MKEKTAITISEYQRDRAALHARDLARINRVGDNLNLEAADVLDYQSSGESRD
jgi:hypothetical protein